MSVPHDHPYTQSTSWSTSAGRPTAPAPASRECSGIGIEPTGKQLAIDGIDHFVLRDGKVVSNFVVTDQLAYGRQIGMMPPDGSAADKAMKAAFNVRTKVARRLKR